MPVGAQLDTAASYVAPLIVLLRRIPSCISPIAHRHRHVIRWQQILLLIVGAPRAREGFVEAARPRRIPAVGVPTWTTPSGRFLARDGLLARRLQHLAVILAANLADEGIPEFAIRVRTIGGPAAHHLIPERVAALVARIRGAARQIDRVLPPEVVITPFSLAFRGSVVLVG